MAKSKSKKTDSKRWSSYWFDEDSYTVGRYGGFYGERNSTKAKKAEGEDADEDDNSLLRKQEKTVEMIKLGAFMRSCSNFVRILTGKDIPVRYEDGDHSYTDGKAVTLSAKVEDNWDSTVGLALHEASHIVLTDFDFMPKMLTDVAYRRTFITNDMIARVIQLNPKIEKWNWREHFQVGTLYPTFGSNASDAHKAGDMYLLLQFKDIWNWVEDRRIDAWVYRTAVGYRGYYEALYDRYFYADEVTKELKTGGMYNEETMDSYLFRTFNLLNPANDLAILKGMVAIKNTIDPANIERLKNTADTAEVAGRVMGIIMNNITALDFTTVKMMRLGYGDGGEDGMTLDLEDMTDEECKQAFGMSKERLKKLLKRFAEQRNFLRGKTAKKKLTKAEAKQMNALQESNVNLELVGGEEFNGQTVRVLVINRLTDAICNSGQFQDILARTTDALTTGTGVPMRGYWTPNTQRAVDEGFVLGRMLGRRLQVRNEEKTLKHTRLDNGKIDRRLVASLGHDVENVFHRIDTDRFNRAHIHISIDASGSMNGQRIYNALRTATAIAVACRMTNNIETVVSFRTTHDNIPVVYIAYDSRVNGVGHIKRYFPLVLATGTTPESLCYEAMMNKVFPKVGVNENFYFVNLSDGEPCFSNSTFAYGGEPAYRHCWRMVSRMMREHGASIISYYICDGYSWGSHDLADFAVMYGRDNVFNINTEKVDEIARTMNRKFLQHSKANNDFGGAV